MKSGSLSTKLIMAFVSLAVLAYFGVQGYRYFASPSTTVTVYGYLAEDTVMMNGYFVRDESVIDCSETLIELTRAEGERVAANKPVAVVYHSRAALEASQQLDELTAQREQLVYAQSAANDTETALRLDTEIETGITNLRALFARGNYTALDAAALALKTTVLKREYAYRGTSDLDARIVALDARIGEVSASVGSAAETVYAPFAGTYSAVADGYETVLTPDSLAELTPAALDAVEPARVTSSVGKLIRGDRWYYVAAIGEREAKGIAAGQELTLRVASGVDFDLPVTVSSVGSVKDGRRVVVLTSREYLSYVTLLRSQSAELILHSYTGLRIPKNALRVSAEGRSGVYCLIGLKAYFKPVEIIYQGEDYCLVTPAELTIPNESQRVLYTLRANDEVIISAEELWNEKVVG